MLDRDTTLKPRSEVLALALPAVVLLLVDWVFWGLRAEQAGWGVNIDGLALLAAFAVALAASSPERASDEPRASLFDGLLQRFAIASFGLLAAGMCGAMFAYVRLSSIWVGPELRSERMGGHAALVALVLIAAPLLAWAIRQGAQRLPHVARIVPAVAAVAFASSLAMRPHKPGARLEYLSAAFHTAAALPAMTLEVHIERVTIAESEFEYLAVANNCVLRPKELEPTRKISTQSAAVPARVSTGGFAVCPAIDIYDASGQIYGLVADSPPGGKALFRVVGGRLTNDPVTDGLYALALPTGEKVGRVPSIRAPLGITSDQDAGDGITVKRDASGLERCRITVRDGDQILAEDLAAFSGSGKTMGACKPVTVKRAATLGIVNVQIPDSDMTTGSPEPSSVSWLDGAPAERISLARVATRVEIPKAWRTGALAGTGCGALALLHALVELVRLRRLRSFVAAHHQGGGKITLSDGAIVDAEAARDLEAGEVFVRGSLPKARLPGYRESAQETARALQVRAPAAVHLDWDRASGRVTFASAIAVAFPIATAGLMLAARVFGLGG